MVNGVGQPSCLVQIAREIGLFLRWWQDFRCYCCFEWRKSFFFLDVMRVVVTELRNRCI